MGDVTRAFEPVEISPAEAAELRVSIPRMPPEFLRELQKLKPHVALSLVRAYEATGRQYARRFPGKTREDAERIARLRWDAEQVRKANEERKRREEREREANAKTNHRDARPSW